MKKIMFNDRYGLTKAVLEGRKTMTRRIIKPQPINVLCAEKLTDGSVDVIQEENLALRLKSPYKIGEIVAVAQSYTAILDQLEDPANFCCSEHWEAIASMRAYYVGFQGHPGATNKMFVSAEYMPHFIRITEIRFERLKDISDEDCLREGVGISATPRETFSALIDKISGRGTWDSNPWVWVYEFKLI